MHIANIKVSNTEWMNINDYLPIDLQPNTTYTINNISTNDLLYIVSEDYPEDKGCILWSGDQLIFKRVLGDLWIATTQNSIYHNTCDIEISEVE